MRDETPIMCPVCKTRDPTRYLRCDYPGCADGRSIPVQSVRAVQSVDVVVPEAEMPRPPLWDFVQAQEAKLKKNDHKKHWRKLPPEALFRKLQIEMSEFEVAYEFEGMDDAMAELVDVANYAMILWDRLRAKALADEESGQGEECLTGSRGT